VSERLYTLSEAADYLRCSVQTLRRRIDQGDLPVFRDRRVVRLRERDLAIYIASRMAQPHRRPRRARAATKGPVRSVVKNLFDLPDPLTGSTRPLDLVSARTENARRRVNAPGPATGRNPPDA
jgi:excisionase family DNA binding protein